jgi:hypothetical protein
VDRLNRPDVTGERQVRMHAIGFPTIVSQARYGENTGVRFATLMRLLCERNGHRQGCPGRLQPPRPSAFSG